MTDITLGPAAESTVTDVGADQPPIKIPLTTLSRLVLLTVRLGNIVDCGSQVAFELEAERCRHPERHQAAEIIKTVRLAPIPSQGRPLAISEYST